MPETLNQQALDALILDVAKLRLQEKAAQEAVREAQDRRQKVSDRLLDAEKALYDEVNERVLAAQ